MKKNPKFSKHHSRGKIEILKNLLSSDDEGKKNPKFFETSIERKDRNEKKISCYGNMSEKNSKFLKHQSRGMIKKKKIYISCHETMSENKLYLLIIENNNFTPQIITNDIGMISGIYQKNSSIRQMSRGSQWFGKLLLVTDYLIYSKFWNICDMGERYFLGIIRLC